ncbi:uncharacterized protein RAG0_17122 [Rhynchosporium agropyri]|uniref:Velvet domain-containing protein n=1 Tax=Rhynchosporium agropyri TaxID=914238 RepID=A0A1E1LSZ1_9HELO|nr:uncharacterized protein RAG0_17122 [Rhynchosporium agropyri]
MNNALQTKNQCAFERSDSSRMGEQSPFDHFVGTKAAEVSGRNRTAEMIGSSQVGQLIVIQEPLVCEVSFGKGKGRKTVEPPPVVQLKVSHLSDPSQDYLQSSHFFLTCSLYGHQGQSLGGIRVSSLRYLVGLDEKEGAFFVFGDVSIKVEGTHRLQFDLYKMEAGEQCVYICGTTSQLFPIVSSKHFHGIQASTDLTRAFIAQSVRLKLRNGRRSLLKPKGPRTDDNRPQNETVGSAYNQGLLLDSQKHQLGSSNNQPRKQLGRSYNKQSFSDSQILDGRQTKRSRTGSEQIQTPTYNMQSQALDTSQYQATGLFTQSAMPTLTPLTQYVGIAHVSLTTRDIFEDNEAWF